MIIGTAGHIDHGKTALVRALTGVDTDRLPEERARGISIELGYAYVPIDDGNVLGFVDVPGHEKFIHTMLAGATGIDFAILVVAADDGIMPQTREHLAILELLDIRAGAVAVTKIDAVSGERAAACQVEVGELISRTGFRSWPVYAVSSRTGAGIDALRQFLQEQALRITRIAGEGRFRLAVDRCFTLPGAGTIAAGTVYSGSVKPGDRLTIAPSGIDVRVRELHAQNRPAAIGVAGQRCALSLAGTPRDHIQRGDWIVDPSIHLSTDRFDARVKSAGGATALRGGMTVHVHAGAARAGARLVVLDEDADASSDADEQYGMLVQLVLQQPMSIWRGDRFIIRDVSAARTLGGGVALDPCAPQRYRRTVDRLATLRAFEHPSPLSQLVALVEISLHGVDVSGFARTGNVPEAPKLAESLDVRCFMTPAKCLAISAVAWRRLRESAEATLAEFHAAHPDLVGLDRARLRRMAFPRLEEVLYGALIDELVADRGIREGGAWLYLPAHETSLTAQERTLIEGVVPRLLARPFDPPWLRELANASGQKEDVLRRAMVGAAKRGDLYQVVPDLFYHPDAVLELASFARELHDLDGRLVVTAFRDKARLGRKRAIQVLEFFDRVGFTRRIKDARTIRRESFLASDHASSRESPPREAASA